MAEYEMKQQNRQSRASANNELGNKHFRRFVDNRKTSYPPIVQFTGPERNSNEAFPFVDMPLTLLYHFPGEKEVNKHCDKSAFLGWSSIQTFDAIENTLKNFNITMGTGHGPINEGYTSNQIVTRGVDSCTVVIISTGSRNLMAHIDIGERNSGDKELEKIKKEIPNSVGANAPLQIFISLLDDRKISGGRAKFARKLIEYYYKLETMQDINSTDGKLEEELTNGIVKGKENIHILVRPESSDNYVQHPEIGIYLNSGKLHIFGSFSNAQDEIKEQTVGQVANEERYFDLPLNAPQEEFNSLSQREKTLLDLASQKQSPSQYQSPLQNLEPMPLQESYLVPRHKASHHYINPFFLKGMLHP